MMSTDKNNKSANKSFVPFYNPWGAWGCLWRTLVFFLGFLLLTFLMALFRGCNDQSPLEKLIDDNDSIANPNNPYRDIPEELRDSSLVKEWNDSIPGIEELPAPEDNYIPPVDSSLIVTNPEDSLSQIIGDQLVVLFNSKNIKGDMADFAQRFKQLYPDSNYEVLYYNPAAGTMLLGVPQDKLIQVANELPQKITGIEFIVTTNEILAESGRPSDPGFSTAKYDEYFKLIQAYDAWDITRGSKDVKVAIVDSYFDLTNPEIGDNRYVDRIHIPSKTVQVLPPSKKPTSKDIVAYSHGSHVAGIAIGSQDNKLGCSGIAPECSWIPVALGDQLTNFNIIEGILYAIYHDADVVNFSIGRQFPPNAKDIPLTQQVDQATKTDKRGEALWEYVIKVANDHNCVLCTSAGNETVLMGLDPKNRSNSFIKVEAVDNKGQMADFSNYGKVPEANLHYSTVSAPGVNLWSVSPKSCSGLWKKEGYVVSAKDGLQEMSGTSMAAPVVAGAVALLKSKNKDLTTEQVMKILTMTAKQFDTQHRIGPTIQIKDALDATGGEKLNFDDLMKDHNLLIGKWKSTHELVVSQNGKKLDDMWTYFIFDSPTSGTLEYRTINLKRVYKGKISVKWEKNRIVISPTTLATDGKGNTMQKDVYICHPNKNRLLEASTIREGKTQYTFELEKVN